MALPTPRQNGGESNQDRDPRRQAVAWLNSDNIREQVERALPNHLPFDWFMRAAQTAILNNPALANADKPSLLRELVAVAQLGLVLDPQLGEAWLIVDSKGKVQRRVGYQGLRKLALQSGKVTALNAQAVYENDRCEISLGDAPSVKHAIDIHAPERGKVIGCYAVGKVEGTNEPVVEWMSWKQIEQHRDRYSDAGRNKKSGPWADNLGEVEMGRKTAFRRLCKWLPKSPLLADALAHEDRADIAAMRTVNPTSAAALPAPDDLPAAADLEDAQQEPPDAQQQRQDAQPPDVEEEPSWTIDGKVYKQPGRVQNILIGKIGQCTELAELETFEGENFAAFLETLPQTNRDAIENAVAHQRSVIEAVDERPSIPTTAAGRPAEDHPMASVDHLEDESFRQAGEKKGGGKGQFNLLGQ